MDAAIFSTDAAVETEERRTASLACSGERRVAVVTISGGMMDLGWAHRLMRPASASMERFVSGTVPHFSDAVRSFVGSLRQILTNSECDHKWWCSVQFVALELTGSRCRLARIGGMRVLGLGPGFHKPLGTEDVLSLPPGAPGIVTAYLLPDAQWRVTGGNGWVQQDAKGEAERMAALVREELHDTEGMESIAVLSHPFWTEVNQSRAAEPSSQEEWRRAMAESVRQAGLRHRSALVAVVSTPR